MKGLGPSRTNDAVALYTADAQRSHDLIDQIGAHLMPGGVPRVVDGEPQTPAQRLEVVLRGAIACKEGVDKLRLLALTRLHCARS